MFFTWPPFWRKCPFYPLKTRPNYAKLTHKTNAWSTILGGVAVKKGTPFLDSGAESPIFGHLKMPKVPILNIWNDNLAGLFFIWLNLNIKQSGQIFNWCKWRHLVAKFATCASGAMLLPNLVQVTKSISGSVVPLAMFSSVPNLILISKF